MILDYVATAAGCDTGQPFTSGADTVGPLPAAVSGLVTGTASPEASGSSVWPLGDFLCAYATC